MLLYLVRHGETDCNIKRIIQGQGVLSHITEEGRRQADFAGRRLKKYGITHAYVSDLVRARETADIICSYTGHTPIIEPMLRERNFGVLEGRTNAEVNEMYPREKYAWRRDYAAAPEGGESLVQVAERTKRFLEMLKKTHTDTDKIMAVMHGGNLRAMLINLLNLPMEYWHCCNFRNTSISVFELNGDRASILTLNDTAHLEFADIIGGDDADNSAV